MCFPMYIHTVTKKGRYVYTHICMGQLDLKRPLHVSQTWQCTKVHIYIYMYVCMYVCIMYVRTHVHTDKLSNVQMFKLSSICIYILMYMCVYIYIHT